MLKKLIAAVFFVLAVFASGCTEKTGALEDPISPTSYVSPTISNLQVVATSISKCSGGILAPSISTNCRSSAPLNLANLRGLVGCLQSFKLRFTKVCISASKGQATETAIA